LRDARNHEPGTSVRSGLPEGNISDLGAHLLQYILYVGCGVTVGIALLTGIGWLTGNRIMTGLLPSSLPMAPSTAIGFLLAAAFLPFTRSRQSRTLATVIYGVVTLLALSQLGSFLWGIPITLDAILVPQPEHFNGVVAGRMSSLTATGFLVAGLSGAVPLRHRAAKDFKGLSGTAVAGLGIVVLLGYLYGRPLLFSAGSDPTTLSTAIGFAFIGSAIAAAAGPQSLPLRLLVGSSARARMIRAFLPSIAIAVFVDALLLAIVPMSNPALTLAVFGAIVAVVVTGGVFTAAHALGNAMDRATGLLAESEAKLRAIFNGNRDAFLIADNDGVFVDANPAACYLFGLARRNLLGMSFQGILQVDGDALWRRFLLLRRISGEIELTPKDRAAQDVEYSLTANILPGQHLIVLRDITESRRRALESERLAAIVGSSSDAIYSKDMSGNIVSWNPGAQRIFGYPGSAIVGRAEDLLYTWSEREKIADAGKMLTRGEAMEPLEISALHADGHELLVSLTESPIWGADGRLVGTSVIVRDVTAHREAEKALRESEERLRAFFESRAVGIVFSGTDGEIAGVNDAFLDLLGYSREDVKAHTLRLSELTPEEFASADRRAYEEAIRFGACRPYEKQNIRKDGSRVWVLLGFVLLEPDRKRSVTFFVDIDEKKRTEEELQKSEQRFSLMFHSSPVAMALSETDSSRVIDVNDRWCEFFGYSREEAVGRTAVELKLWVNPEDRVKLVEGIGSDGISTMEGEMRPNAGDTRYALISMTAPILTAASESVRIVTLIDTTARRELEAQLNQSQKMEAVGRLAGGVAHDFNNMLGVILGFAELLVKDAEEDDRKKIEQIIRAGRRAAGLTNQLLAFSRKQLLEPQVISLNRLVTGIVTMLRRLIGEDIRLDTELAPNLADVKADPGQLEQVVMNLAVNSRDAMPEGGTLRIATKNAVLDKSYSSRHEPVAPGEYVMLSISDTGSGMDEDTIEHLFEPFFTTKEQGKGTGLGLSTAYGIIKQSAGHVWVYSEIDRGTTFEIFFPRVESETTATEAPGISEDGAGTETILLAEDEDSLRMMIDEVLTRKGYTVIQAKDGEAAVDLASERGKEIRLLISDVVMPGMRGNQLATTLVGMLPQLKVLFISGYTAEVSSLDRLLSSKTHFLSKPFSNSALLAAVRGVLDE